MRALYWISFYCFLIFFPTEAFDIDDFQANDLEKEIREEKLFLKAYLLYVKARAGEAQDKTSYSSAADAFMIAFPVVEDRLLKLRALWYAALCYFLDFKANESLNACRQFRAFYGEQPESSFRRDEKTASELLALIARRYQAAKLYSNIKDSNLKRFVLSKNKDDNSDKIHGFCVNTIADFANEMAISLSRVRAQLEQAVCVENLHVIGAAFLLYFQEHEGSLPPDFEKERWLWYAYLFPYTGDKGAAWNARGPVWVCPSKNRRAYCYGINETLIKNVGSMKNIKNPNLTCLVADSVYYSRGAYPHNPSYGGSSCRIQHEPERQWLGSIDFKRS
jgi:hypothetical protein